MAKDMKPDQDDELKSILKEIADIIGRSLPPGHGFMLCFFSRGSGGYMNYLSNANRSDMREALKELIGVLDKEGN